VVMAETATMSGDRLFWSRSAQVRTSRRFVVAGLAGRPVAVDRDVVALLVSELVTNAVVHPASGRADGTLLVGYQLARDGLDPKRLRLRWRSATLAAQPILDAAGMRSNPAGGGAWGWWRRSPVAGEWVVTRAAGWSGSSSSWPW
jgi:hypothetical protein